MAEFVAEDVEVTGAAKDGAVHDEHIFLVGDGVDGAGEGIFAAIVAEQATPTGVTDRLRGGVEDVDAAVSVDVEGAGRFVVTKGGGDDVVGLVEAGGCCL